MNKTLILLCLIVVIISLSSCSGNVQNAEIHIGSSSIFSEDEINAAVTAVLNKFKDFTGCTLLKLWYDESESNNHVQSYMNYGRGSQNGVEQTNVIVLFSNFYAGSTACPSLNRNSTITNWSWILTRESAACEWTVDDWGY